MDQPPWLAAAWTEFGVHEIPGPQESADILRYFRDAGDASVTSEATPWCAAFVGAMLKRAGYPGTGSLLARSYLAWGDALDAPRLGAVTVLSRGDDPTLGHVGFYIGESINHLFLLGGNQGEAVTVAPCDKTRLLGYRWPHNEQDASTASTDDAVFRKCLVHVLQMEGGFSDDPYDPGGPTNLGITLGEFARFKGETLDAQSRNRLIGELKRIPDETVRTIYRRRYFEPASCPAFTAPLALMHFDAAVNHGVGGAILMLQGIAGVTVDGEIGPETLGSIGARSVMDLVEDYAEARRTRYGALPHFWRFGRGWLARVDATLTLARQWAAADGITSSLIEPATNAKGTPAMSDDTTNAASPQAEPGKWWVQSKTVWGTLITAAATVIPVLAPVIGISLPADVIRDFGTQTVTAVQAIAGLFGTVLAIYGRLKADTPLATRKINLQI